MNNNMNFKRVFTDCRLETYFHLLECLGVTPDRNEYFLVASPMKSSVKILKLFSNGKQVECPIVQCIDHEFKYRILDHYSISEGRKSFDNLSDEVEYLKENAGKIPMVVDVVGNYLNPALTEKQKAAPIGSVSTVQIVGADTERNKFNIGMIDISTNRMIELSIDDYIQARRKFYLPFQLDMNVYTYLRNGSGTKSNSDLNELLSDQLERLRSENTLEELIECIKVCIYKSKSEKALLSMQKDFLHSSLILGNTSFFFYELASAARCCACMDEFSCDSLMRIGGVYKKIIHTFGREKEQDGIESVIKLSERFEMLSELRKKALDTIRIFSPQLSV